MWQGAQRLFSGLQGQASRFGGRLDDLEVLQARQAYAGHGPEATGHLDHLWFELAEHGPGAETWRGHRVVKLAELRYLPQEARADAALVQKMAALLRGLYAASVELVVVDFAMWDPPRGIVQCYGVASRHVSLDTARRLAESAYATLVGAFTAQFPQSQLMPLSGEGARWLFEALRSMAHVTTLIGSPDPRESARGGQQQQPGLQSTPQFTQQQNELLFRALARAGEEFCLVNIATPVSRTAIAAMLAGLADLTSPIASRQQGVKSIGFGISLPMILSVGEGYSAGRNFGQSEQHGESDSTSEAHGQAHTEGEAHTSGWAYTQGSAHTEGQAVTDSASQTTGQTHSTSVMEGISQSQGVSHTEGQSQSHGVSQTSGSSQSHGESSSTGHTSGVSASESQSQNWGVAVPISVSPAGVGIGVTPSIGASQGVSFGTSEATMVGSAVSDVSTVMNSTSVSDVQSQSQADTVSQSQSVSHGVSQIDGTFASQSTGHAETRSQADTQSEAYTVSGAVTRSAADTVSHSTGESHGVSHSQGVTQGQMLGAAQTHGLGAGVAPSASVSKSFAWKDEAAAALAMLLEQQLNLLKEASEEGGLYSDVYILTRTENGRRVAEAAAVQAFGGSQGVVTHLQVRRPESEAEAEHLRLHARCLTPSTLTETLGYLNGYAYSSFITLTQQAAYAAPGLFEEGTALTTQERTPPFAFVADMPGEAVLGHLYSTERGELTRARLALAEERHFHTVFAADTGFGKTVAAERLAVEVVSQWHHRAVVLDFGAGWRRLANGPLPRARVDLYQLFPGAVRPFRWNFLQVGRRMQPDRQLLATAELLANAGRMGPRQLGFIRRAMRELDERYGVLTSDPKVLADASWNTVRPGEAQVLARARVERGLLAVTPPAGASLIDLQPFERQALAVHRSKQVDVTKLYDILKGYLERVRDLSSRQSLEGVLLRVEPFTQGELALMYGGGEGSIAVEDLGLLGPEPNPADRWGLCVLEGGAEMDDYSKAVILSLVAWHLYNDSVIRRRESIGGFNRQMDIFWEEANKILNGAVQTTGDDVGTSSAASVTQLWQAMWRDGRKYKIFLHPLVQTLSELPPGILSSCNNAFFGQMKNLKDRDLAVGHLARSERGVHDEEYKRWISRIPVAQAIVKLGWSERVADVEPMLARPLRVSAAEPSDGEILQRFSRLGLAGSR
ncbi:MAG: serine-rich protein [Anaerolineales bacterium]|nr:serine-rich protein [Anaerolineales bacterium]